MFRSVIFAITMAAGLAVAQTIWPELPESHYVAGRQATIEDVVAGRAVFVVEVDGVLLGTPLEIDIPQFAYHNGERGKEPVVIVQGEEARGQRIIGARYVDGSELVGLLEEFELIGKETP
jgi:hypothetical protein